MGSFIISKNELIFTKFFFVDTTCVVNDIIYRCVKKGTKNAYALAIRLAKLFFFFSALAYLSHFDGSFFECCVCKTKSVVDLHDTTQQDLVQPSMAMCRCLVWILCDIVVVAWCAYSSCMFLLLLLLLLLLLPLPLLLLLLLLLCCTVIVVFLVPLLMFVIVARAIQCIGVSDTIPSFRLFQCSELLYIFFNSNFNPMLGYLHTQHQFCYTQLTAVHISPFSMNFWPVFNC